MLKPPETSKWNDPTFDIASDDRSNTSSASISTEIEALPVDGVDAVDGRGVGVGGAGVEVGTGVGVGGTGVGVAVGSGVDVGVGSGSPPPHATARPIARATKPKRTLLSILRSRILYSSSRSEG